MKVKKKKSIKDKMELNRKLIKGAKVVASVLSLVAIKKREDILGIVKKII